jgi:type IV conjugative transfer system pilin TraA
MKTVFNTLKNNVMSYGFFVLGLLLSPLSFAGDATDPLATLVKPEVAAIFGPNSTAAYCIYLAEIIVGSIAYIKTKNLLLLISVVILVVFTRAMFSYISK